MTSSKIDDGPNLLYATARWSMPDAARVKTLWFNIIVTSILPDATVGCCMPDDTHCGNITIGPTNNQSTKWVLSYVSKTCKQFFFLFLQIKKKMHFSFVRFAFNCRERGYCYRSLSHWSGEVVSSHAQFHRLLVSHKRNLAEKTIICRRIGGREWGVGRDFNV